MSAALLLFGCDERRSDLRALARFWTDAGLAFADVCLVYPRPPTR